MDNINFDSLGLSGDRDVVPHKAASVDSHASLDSMRVDEWDGGMEGEEQRPLTVSTSSAGLSDSRSRMAGSPDASAWLASSPGDAQPLAPCSVQPVPLVSDHQSLACQILTEGSISDDLDESPPVVSREQADRLRVEAVTSQSPHGREITKRIHDWSSGVRFPSPGTPGWSNLSSDSRIVDSTLHPQYPTGGISQAIHAAKLREKWRPEEAESGRAAAPFARERRGSPLDGQMDWALQLVGNASQVISDAAAKIFTYSWRSKFSRMTGVLPPSDARIAPSLNDYKRAISSKGAERQFGKNTPIQGATPHQTVQGPTAQLHSTNPQQIRQVRERGQMEPERIRNQPAESPLVTQASDRIIGRKKIAELAHIRRIRGLDSGQRQIQDLVSVVRASSSQLDSTINSSSIEKRPVKSSVSPIGHPKLQGAPQQSRSQYSGVRITSTVLKLVDRTR